MDAEIRRMEAMREAAAARLNGLLNRPAETPVPAPVLGQLPLEYPSADTLRAWADQARPMLEQRRLAVERAESQRALARREIWPDFTIGLQYGQRPGIMGTERMASAMVGFSLPIFASKRQYRMRDETEAMEQMARAELAEMQAGVDARIRELLADLERDRTLIRLYRTEVLPQADANVESAFSSYRVGSVDFMTLVDARMTANRYQQELYSLLADYGRAVADLEMTVGREIPRAGTVLSEVR
jgi:outer membrane protein TolC